MKAVGEFVQWLFCFLFGHELMATGRKAKILYQARCRMCGRLFAIGETVELPWNQQMEEHFKARESL